MVYSEFLQRCLSGHIDIIWNYYGTDVNCDDILQAGVADSFIHQYFKQGNKYLPLLLNPRDSSRFLENYFATGRKENVVSIGFDQNYLLPGNRAVHTVSGFFLGLLIEKCLNSTNTLSIDYPNYFPFSYLWFLTFLYHDYGYCVAERKEAPVAVPKRAPTPDQFSSRVFSKMHIGEYRALHKVKKELGITLSPFSPFPAFSSASKCRRKETLSEQPVTENKLLQELTQCSCAKAGHLELRFNNRAVIKNHQYTSTILTRYFNYCINDRMRIDHGVIGGYLFYDRMIKNYAFAYLAALQETKCEINLSDFFYRDRHFNKSQLPLFLYISDCIMSHNIWKLSEENRESYKLYMLDNALGEAFKIISYDTNPLLYILVVADSLEPTKIYKDTSAKTVSAAIDIEYLPGSRKLTFSSNNSIVDINILHQKAKSLEDWTTVHCSELINGKFDLFLL